MEGVEDIPGTALTEGITWDWESFEGYLDALDARQYAIDVGAQVAHGPVRAYVMGERGAANEPATAGRHRGDGRRSSSAGCGPARSASPRRARRSTGRSRASSCPGTNADADELYGIGEGLRRAGHGVFQFAPDHVDVPTGEWPWMKELARRTGRTVSVNLNQPDSAPDLWRDVLGLLDEARAEGIPIVAQVAGRVVGLLMCLEGSFNPLTFHPAYAPIAALPLAEQVGGAAAIPSCAAALAVEPDDGGLFRKVVLDKLDSWWAVADGDIDYEPDRADSIGAIAARTGRRPDGADHRPADRPRRPRDDPHAVLQLRVRRPRVHLRSPPASRHPDGARRRRRPLRRDLRRRHADVHADALDPRSHRAVRSSRSNTSCTARPARPPSCTASAIAG